MRAARPPRQLRQGDLSPGNEVFGDRPAAPPVDPRRGTALGHRSGAGGRLLPDLAALIRQSSADRLLDRIESRDLLQRFLNHWALPGGVDVMDFAPDMRSDKHTSELQSQMR